MSDVNDQSPGPASGPASGSPSADHEEQNISSWAAGGPIEARRIAAAMRHLTGWLVAGPDHRDQLPIVADELERLAALVDGPILGSRYDGPLRSDDDPRGVSGHPFAGASNPLSPPIAIEISDGVVFGRGRFNAAYEGPPGAVHGGYVAGVFDVICAMAARSSSRAAVTHSLTIRYLRPTPLGEEVTFRAETVEREGNHLHVRGQLSAFEDFVTAEAEGVFAETRRPGFSGLL